jgi:hypothetical protein
MKNSTEYPLPLELLTDIFQHLPLPDQQSLSLTSQLTRKLALRFIFRRPCSTLGREGYKSRHNFCLLSLIAISNSSFENSSWCPVDLKNDERNIVFKIPGILPEFTFLYSHSSFPPRLAS